MSLYGTAAQRFVVAVDIDEVLCQYCEGFVRWHFGPPAVQDPGQCFRLTYAPPQAAARERFLSTWQFEDLDLVTGALEALTTLRRLGCFEIQAVTARPPSCRAPTERFLARRFPGLVSGLHFAEVAQKGGICRALGASILVDDQLANALDASRSGVPAVLLDVDGAYTWNSVPAHAGMMPPGVVRRVSWQQALECILAICQQTPQRITPLVRKLSTTGIDARAARLLGMWRDLSGTVYEITHASFPDATDPKLAEITSGGITYDVDVINGSVHWACGDRWDPLAVR